MLPPSIDSIKIRGDKEIKTSRIKDIKTVFFAYYHFTVGHSEDALKIAVLKLEE